MTLRARLLSVLAGVLFVAFAASGFAQYDAMRRALLDEVDRTLLVRGVAVVRELELLGTEWLVPGRLQGLNLAAEPLERAQAPEVFVQIRDARGRLVAASQNVATMALPVPGDLSQQTFYNVSRGSSPPLRLMAAPVLALNRPVGTVVVGQSMQVVNGSLERATWRMLGIAGVSLVATVLLMNFLLASELAPLRRVASTAREIVSTGDVSRRVATTPASSEVRHVAEAFNSVVARVERQLEAQKRLLADTSHELGNPLTVLRTDLDLLRHCPDAETQAEVVAEADKEAERMGRLLDELLQLSGADVAPLPVADTPVPLDEMAVRLVDRMRPVAGERDLRVEIVQSPVVRGDVDRLEQTLNNLLENAIRHTGARGRISVAVREATGQALLSVRDDGEGIAAEHLPHVFERFYRVDRARSRASGGTGLGLSIALMIAQAHGGSITVESRPGEGSTFTIHLPTAGSAAVTRSCTPVERQGGRG